MNEIIHQEALLYGSTERTLGPICDMLKSCVPTGLVVSLDVKYRGMKETPSRCKRVYQCSHAVLGFGMP